MEKKDTYTQTMEIMRKIDIDKLKVQRMRKRDILQIVEGNDEERDIYVDGRRQR